MDEILFKISKCSDLKKCFSECSESITPIKLPSKTRGTEISEYLPKSSTTYLGSLVQSLIISASNDCATDPTIPWPIFKFIGLETVHSSPRLGP